MQRARLGRRNRKGSVFLAFSDVETSSLLLASWMFIVLSPCGRYPSSLSITLHRHYVASRRSFLDHCSRFVALQLDCRLK